jgi:hypothetical protein
MRNLAMKYGASIFDLLVDAGTSGGQLRSILTDNWIKLDPRWKVENENWSMALSAFAEKPMPLYVRWCGVVVVIGQFVSGPAELYDHARSIFRIF